MKPQPPRWSQECRIVAGADAVQSLRSYAPTIPIVALVDESSPIESVLAQAAGADVVLAVPQPHATGDHIPGLDLALQAACTAARRRHKVATASQRVSHDVAQALNVIALAAEAGGHGRLDPAAAFDQIGEWARAAGVEAWRAGHAFRSSSRVITGVELRRLLRNASFDVGVDIDVEIIPPEHETLVFADERQLIEAITEMLENSRRSGATWIRVETAVSRAGHVDVGVTDDGDGFCGEQQAAIGQPFNAASDSDHLGLGLAAIAEYAAELGGGLELKDPGRNGRPTHVVLSLPTIDGSSAVAVAQEATVDQVAAQAGILEGVVRHAPLEESLEAVVAAIEHQLPGAVCSVLLLDSDRRLHHIAGARLPITYRESIDGVPIGPGQGSCGTAAHVGRPVVASDVTIDDNWTDFRDIATEHGLRSCWSTPIVAAEGGGVLGTFAVYKPTVWEPDQAAIRLVDRFTYLAAVAIEHHRLFGALAESEARFRSAFEGTAAGIALVSLDGTFLKVNPALSDLVGHSPSGLVGTNLLDLVEPSHRSLVTESWTEVADAASAAPVLRTVDVPLQTPNCSPPMWLSLRASLISGESDRQPYLYVEVRDITAARKQLVDLRAREVAEAANQAKSDFLALVSHELRTPLNVILGFAQVMQLIDLDKPRRTESVDQIVKAGRHLRDLIDGLLDLSRIESGQLPVAAEPVETRTVIGEAMELVRPLASSRHIELVDRTTSELAHYVVADSRCLRQVLINLLDNAVKYTGANGRVEVAVSVSPNGFGRISVTDSGPGIPPDSLEDIFQPFHRLDGGTDEGREGIGLGLALCARLMHEMGGSIDVTSTVGTGSCFWLDLPTSPHPDRTVRKQLGMSVALAGVDLALSYPSVGGDVAQAVDALNQ